MKLEPAFYDIVEIKEIVKDDSGALRKICFEDLNTDKINCVEIPNSYKFVAYKRYKISGSPSMVSPSIHRDDFEIYGYFNEKNNTVIEISIHDYSERQYDQNIDDYVLIDMTGIEIKKEDVKGSLKDEWREWRLFDDFKSISVWKEGGKTRRRLPVKCQTRKGE